MNIYTVNDIAKRLEIHNVKDVRGNLTLPTKGENGSIITWESEKPQIITESGEVTRPHYGYGDEVVKLVATITLNGEVTYKEFQAHVKEMPKQEEFTGYLFSYFIGEDREDGEQIYFAISEENDPLDWKELNDGKVVFESKLGEKGLRDPFIIRSPSHQVVDRSWFGSQRTWSIGLNKEW